MQTDRVIYIADDDEDNHFFIQKAWRRAEPSYSLVFFKDGQELMDHFTGMVPHTRGALPSLILLDLSMPRKNGFEVLEELQDDPILSQIPVVILTSSHGAGDDKRCYALGARLFLTKPVELDMYVRLMCLLDHLCQLMDSVVASKSALTNG